MLRKKFINKILDKIDIKIISVLPIILGVLFLLAASYNRYSFLIVLLGLLAIAKGVLGIVATERMKRITEAFMKLPNNICKIWGVVMILIGSIVLTGI